MATVQPIMRARVSITGTNLEKELQNEMKELNYLK